MEYSPCTEKPGPKLRWSPGCHIMLVAGCLMVLFTGVLFFMRQRLSILSSSPPPPAVLAVLPFEDTGEEPQKNQISDDLTTGLMTRLEGLEPDRLKVIPPETAVLYKGRPLQVDAIGRELKADFILTGTVRQEGLQVLVSATLLRVADQKPLWAETYESKLGALGQIQDTLVQMVSERIRAATVRGD